MSLTGNDSDNVNDPATILADADNFLTKYFKSTDADEVMNTVGKIFADVWKMDRDFELLGRLTAALIQVYDLVLPFDGTMAGCFLQRLGAMAKAVLANRDDMPHPPPPPPPPQPILHDPYFDQFRKRIMPAWGFFTHDRDNKWNTDPYSSGLLSYAMVAFARRVADHPVRYAKQQDDAIRFITAVIETYQAFREHELHLVEGDRHAYFNSPLAYGSLDCPDGQYHDRCKGYHDGAGKTIAFNENLAMMEALAECALAADSALYRGSADATPDTLRLATEEMPLVVAKNVAFFVDNLASYTDSLYDGTPYFQPWDKQPGGPTEDLDHAGLELACLAVIYDLQTGLNSLLARAGRPERIPVSISEDGTSVGVRFANTFLRKLWRGDILAGGLDGSNPKTDVNAKCAGWIPFAQFDQWVWRRCLTTTFYYPHANPPDLNVDNHAALLRYREFNSNSTKYLRDFAGQNWVITPAPLAVGESRPTSIHDQKWLLVLSGVVIANLRGEDGEWGHQTVSFTPDMAGPDDPDSTSGPLNWAINQYSIPKPAGSPGMDYLIRFSVEECAPFVAPNSMFNASGTLTLADFVNPSMNCGFAVDAFSPNPFGTGADVLTNQTVESVFSGINANLAVREKDAWLYRLGYRISLVGKIVFVAPSPAPTWCMPVVGQFSQTDPSA